MTYVVEAEQMIQWNMQCCNAVQCIRVYHAFSIICHFWVFKNTI